MPNYGATRYIKLHWLCKTYAHTHTCDERPIMRPFLSTICVHLLQPCKIFHVIPKNGGPQNCPS